jgi:hypothetical protein
MPTVSRVVLCGIAGAFVFGLADAVDLTAQFPAVNPQIRSAKGQNVSPVYEGWFRGSDGSTYASFGYFNRNTEEVVHTPVGPDNKIEPGPADQGQPTRFYPGRQVGVFAIALPKDRPGAEATWTLTVAGRTLAIPTSLDQQYLLEPLKEMGGSHPGNTPPVLRFEANGPAIQGPAGRTVERTATVSTPLALDVWVTDDGLPPPEPPRPTGGGRQGAPTPTAADARPATTARVAPPRGLGVTWSQFRGSAGVTFANPTPPIEQGKASTTATFSEPGDYTLRVLASDGTSFSAQCCWTNGYVKVTVRGASGR